MSDWKIIHGFEDYEVSRQGQVRRATAGRGTTIGQIIKPHTQAWCAEHGVELREARQWVDAETGEVLA